MTRLVIVLASLAALAGCKKKETSSRGLAEALTKMSQFADSMCHCKDKACADTVQEQMTKWATNAAEQESWTKQTPDHGSVKRMTYLGQRYATCLRVAVRPPAPPEKPKLPAAVASPATVEALLASARTWARGEHEQLHVVQLDLSYVGADGVVDPDFGKVSFELGRAAKIADDPKRRTGAPVLPAASQPTRCMELAWTAKGWTKETREVCRDAAAPFPRCPVATVWKRAIDKGAPSDALAVLTLRESANRVWTFAINDEPRKVAISHSVADDCELEVEKP